LLETGKYKLKKGFGQNMVFRGPFVYKGKIIGTLTRSQLLSSRACNSFLEKKNDKKFGKQI